ncbi:MAG: FAD-dependent thymidylate synthase [Spirochaetes bacterium]|nr:FAD-dependent thymidylate synthase [Spirochaetota bacterium]
MHDIFIFDEFSPEDTAMLQALYSRSPKSVKEHADKVRQTGSGKFMETYYVGYNHKSIGDCGTTTIFIEHVSELAAKAIQDWPLYSGQQTSSRYIDFSKQPLIDPVGSDESADIQKAWMNFYKDSLVPVSENLKKRCPKKDKEKQIIYDKAILARTFDILRAFLPAGVSTQLSWHTNLRQVWDKLSNMRYHPLEEIRNIAENLLEKLKHKYPSSFNYKLYEEQENYRKYSTTEYSYYAPRNDKKFAMNTTIKPEILHRYKKLILERPVKTELPGFLAELGNINFSFVMDYGSFRDLQRHRNGICRMPLVTGMHGFEPWYLDQLPPEIRLKADELIKKQTQRISTLDTSTEVKQYYYAMGYLCSCKLTYGLPEAVYVTELRSGSTVHPTLRKIAHNMHSSLLKHFDVLKLYTDKSPDEFIVARGKADIIKKG